MVDINVTNFKKGINKLKIPVFISHFFQADLKPLIKY
jgi:hypothetical protein